MVYSLRSARRGSRQAASQGLVLDPTDGLHLVGVSLGAELVVVSVLALVSVSLQDVLVTTVTGELVGHPAAGEKRGRNEGEMRQNKKNTVNKEVLRHGWNVETSQLWIKLTLNAPHCHLSFEKWDVKVAKDMIQSEAGRRNSRSGVDFDGGNLLAAPAHGL